MKTGLFTTWSIIALAMITTPAVFARGGGGHASGGHSGGGSFTHSGGHTAMVAQSSGHQSSGEHWVHSQTFRSQGTFRSHRFFTRDAEVRHHRRHFDDDDFVVESDVFPLVFDPYWDDDPDLWWHRHEHVIYYEHHRRNHHNHDHNEHHRHEHHLTAN